MLNPAIGATSIQPDGKQLILTRAGEAGHAVYGPYDRLTPGNYIVEFELSLAGDTVLDGDPVLGSIEVVSEHGATFNAHADFRASQLRDKPTRLSLRFTADRIGIFQFRVYANGTTELLVADRPVLARIEGRSDGRAELAAARFPDVTDGRVPRFFVEHQHTMRQLHDNGATFRFEGDCTIVTLDGVSFNARTIDDIYFVREIFYQPNYNFFHPHDACVIDVGMNVGLVTLTLGVKDFVKEVHSFEPFKSTYDRAVANLARNPAIQRKTTAYNFGLGGKDQELAVTMIEGDGLSGANSTRGMPEGKPTTIELRNAATVLKPIVAAAKAKNRDVIAKIDCEGSEFDIFDVLAEANLWKDISAVMIEWHRVDPARTQTDLMDMLFRYGFSTIDVSPRYGNGFFYAVKSR